MADTAAFCVLALVCPKHAGSLMLVLSYLDSFSFVSRGTIFCDHISNIQCSYFHELGARDTILSAELTGKVRP